MARKNKELEDTEPDADWATVVGGPGDIPFRPHAAATAPPKQQRGDGRTWLIVLMSFVVQLAAVLAAGSTGVVDRALRYSTNHNDLLGGFARLPAVVAWRLTPPLRDPYRVFPAQLFGLLALFVVAALLTVALVRGPVTFWRAFVGIVLSVTAATLVAGMVERGVVNDRGAYARFGGKAGGVLFAGSGYEVVAGVIIGVLAAVVGAVVAVVSRRPVEVVLPVVPVEPDSYVEPPPPPPWHGVEPHDTQATTQFERVRTSSEPDPSEAAPTQAAPNDATQTFPAATETSRSQRPDFPTPPDDEALGHHDHHDHHDHED